ncbi:Unknown protein, partial [Striga hermonthica]
VNWLPYGRNPADMEARTPYGGCIRYRDIVEPYNPLRLLRQLGYVQRIPPRIRRPASVVRAWESRLYKVEHSAEAAECSWDEFPQLSVVNLAAYTPTTVTPGEVELGYSEWFARVYRLKLLGGDPAEPPPVPSRVDASY